jgi:hypothetical protein
MTPILLLVACLLVLDVLVLLGRSHDSRDGRDWQPRGSPSPGPSAVPPSDDQIAVDSPRSREPINQGPWAVVAGVGGARPGNPWREGREIHTRAR